MELRWFLLYLKNVLISIVGSRILIPKMKKKNHLRLRIVHACSWGRSVKIFCNLREAEPKVACPVTKLLFLVWICLTESCLATCDFSRYLTLPFAICRKEKTPGELAEPLLGRGCWQLCEGLSRSGHGPSSHTGWSQQPCRLTASDLRAWQT